MKILILGGDGVNEMNPMKAVYCFDLIASVMYEELTKLGVGCYHVHAGKFHGSHYNKNLLEPYTDLALFIGYAVTDKMNFRRMQNDGISKIVSLLEVPVPHVDWSYYFVDTHDSIKQNTTKIFAPCCKRLYQNQPKMKMILLDHKQENANNRWDGKLGDEDWTDRISDWVTEIKNDYSIFRMERFGEELKRHEFGIKHDTFREYLDVTKFFETYIVTHAEGYGYSVIDMLARGIRVTAPSGFLNPEFIKKFKIPTFNNKEELLKIIRSPVDDHWNHCIDSMTDYSVIAKTIYEQWKMK